MTKCPNKFIIWWRLLTGRFTRVTSMDIGRDGYGAIVSGLYDEKTNVLYLKKPSPVLGADHDPSPSGENQ